MLKVRSFSCPVGCRPALRPSRVGLRCLSTHRKDGVLRAVPSRQLQSDLTRVLDNVDETSKKKTKPSRSKVRREEKASSNEVNDWVEDQEDKSSEEWGVEENGDQEEQQEDSKKGENFRSDGYSYYKASSISVLSETEKELILPLIPVGDQAGFYSPSELPAKLAWWGTALCGCVLFSSNGWLAALFLSSPLLIPWGMAGIRNWELQAKGSGFVGIWHCQVLNVEVLEKNVKKKSGNLPGQGSNSPHKLIRLLIGDPWKGGARVEMVVPIPEREEPPSIGELSDLLVLTDREDFAVFKVVREAFFPRTRLWLSEYPFIDREAFYRTVCAIQKQQNEILMDEDNW